MATNIFGSVGTDPVVVKSDKVIVSTNLGGNEAMLALSVTVTFERGVEFVPVLGKTKLISVGIPQGRLQAQTVLSTKTSVIQAFGLTGEKDCEGFTLDLNFDADQCNTLKGCKVTLHGCVSQAVNLEVQAGRGYIAEGVSVVFTGLEIEDGAGGKTTGGASAASATAASPTGTGGNVI